MTELQKSIIIFGIRIKLARGEDLETILASYTKLTNVEKQELRTALRYK